MNLEVSSNITEDVSQWPRCPICGRKEGMFVPPKRWYGANPKDLACDLCNVDFYLRGGELISICGQRGIETHLL